MANVKVVFDADSGKFQSAVDGMDKAVQKASDNVAKAKNAILQWGKSSVEAAKEAGASSEKLASIQERTAQRLATVTEQNASRVINALDRQAQKAREVATEMQNLNKVVDISTAKGGLNDISNRLKTSTVLRVSEGSTSIRGAEAFISAVPVLSKLTDFVFPIASAIGFVAIIGEGVSKLREMYENAHKVSSALAEGFEAINEPLINTADNLQKDNDQLKSVIAKLEHKPTNGLAIALDDARINADKLAESATKASDAVVKLLNANNVSRLNSMFTGQVATGDIEAHLKKAFSDIAAASNDDEKKFRYDTSALATPEQKKNALDEHNKRLDEIQAQRQALQGYIRQQREWVNGSHLYEGNWGKYSLPNVTGDKSAFNNLLNGSEDVLDSQQEIAAGMRLNPTLQGTKATLEGAKQAAADTNKAKEQQLKSLENYVNVWKTMAPVSSKAVYDFWQSQLAAFKGFPEQLDAINTKLADLATEGANKAHETIQKFKDEQKKSDSSLFDIKPIDVLGNTKESGQQLANEYQRAALASDQLAAELAKTKIQIDLANGSISKQTADQRLAAIAAQDHADRLAYLRDQLSQFQKSATTWNPATQSYDSNKEQQEYVGLNADIAKEQTSAAVDAMKDAAQQTADTWKGALNEAFDQWVQHATDTASQVRAIFQQTVNGFNENLVNMMSGDYKKGDWSKYAHSMFKTGASDLLQQGEGHLAKAFGINIGKGKPDGSKANPYYVIPAGSGGLGGGQGSGGLGSLVSNGDDSDSSKSGLGGFLSKLFGSGTNSNSGSDDQSSGIGGFFSSLFGSMFGGGKAVGGDVSVGHIYQINENGQELFAPSVNGRMIPHGQSAPSRGGNAYYSFNVGEGLSPEETDMRIRAALAEYHPQVQRIAVQAVQEHQRSLPARR